MPFPESAEVKACREAIERGDPEGVRKLLETGFNPNCITEMGLSPLSLSMSHEYRDIFQLLVRGGANLHQADNSPLVLMLLRGDFAAAEWLLQQGMDVNHGAGKLGTTLLHTIVMNPKSDVLRWLLEHGADPNRPNASGETPLIACAKKGNVEFARMLVDAGADVRRPRVWTQWGKEFRESALKVARDHRQPGMIDFLTAAGATE